MSKRNPEGKKWTLRYDPRQGYVTTGSHDDNQIIVAIPQQQDHGPVRLEFLAMLRKDARLLAKRLNSCLDETTLHKGG